MIAGLKVMNFILKKENQQSLVTIDPILHCEMHVLHVTAPGNVAAVKGRGPSDWTNHSQQEKRYHAKRSWSHARVKGQRGDAQRDITVFVLPVF